MSTKKLFWDDPYQTKCTAIVTNINAHKVKLNQTIFYAFSGGQGSDEGTIDGIKVIEAKKEGDKENIIDIEYILECQPPFKVGDQVEVIIDSERRRKLRNLHSAAHILYYLVIEMLGPITIVGSNISPDKARMDFLYDQALNEKIASIEQKVNHFIQEDHIITMKNDKEKKDLRWWMCENWKMPCGGTHVKSTKEICSIRLKRVNIGKGKERIEIYLENQKN
jgi:Ser-tRNA(Ala) deacylase AlaX